MDDQLLIQFDNPIRGVWLAAPDGYDGTVCIDPKDEDRRIGQGATKWEAMRDLADRMEEIDDARKSKAVKK